MQAFKIARGDGRNMGAGGGGGRERDSHIKVTVI